MLVLVSEGLGIHLWLVHRHALLAWIFTLTTLSAMVWLALDYRAFGQGVVALESDELELKVGRRFDFRLPRASIVSATKPVWRDLPEPGMPASADYINLMKQATPNILLTLSDPVRIKLPAGRSKNVKRIAMHLDEPEMFLKEFAK